MKFLNILLLLIPGLLIGQEQQVELVEVKVEDGIMLKGVNHIQDQAISFVLEITSVGFGLKKLETISKVIPAGGELDIVKLVPRPNRECSYSASFSYETKQAQATRLVEQKKVKRAEQNANVKAKQASKTKNEQPIKATVEMDGIVVYSKNGCGRCEYVTNYLKLNEIPFTDLNVTTSQRSKDLMSEVLYADGYKGGSFMTPVITVNGEVYYNIKDIKGFVQDLNVDK